MSETEEQAVVGETDDQPKVDTEVKDAQADDTDDLDKLLAEYEKSAGSDDTSSKPGESGEAQDQDLRKEIESLRNDFARMSTQEDLSKAVKAVRGDLDPEAFDDKFMELWLDRQAIEDPRLQQAWANRQNNPKQFEKVLSSLNKNFTKKFGSLPSKEMTDDREAVAQAVRGASTKAPEGKAPEYGSKSDQEFAADVEKTYGFRPL